MQVAEGMPRLLRFTRSMGCNQYLLVGLGFWVYWIHHLCLDLLGYHQATSTIAVSHK